MTITFHFVRNLFFYLLNDFYITLNNKMTPDVIDIIIENKSLFVNILQFEDFENQEKHSTPFATSTWSFVWSQSVNDWKKSIG